MTVFLSALMFPFFFYRSDPDLPVNLEDISGIAGAALPGGALNHRRSAHFIEINSIYSAEMERRVVEA